MSDEEGKRGEGCGLANVEAQREGRVSNSSHILLMENKHRIFFVF